MQEKILVIAPAWVGDMVIAQPLFQVLKARFPGSSIDVLAPSWTQPLADRIPEITNSWISPFPHGEGNWLGRYRLARTLRAYDYQRCYVLPNTWKSAVIPFWAKIPIRIGWRGEWRYRLLTHLRPVDRVRYPRMVDHYMALAYQDMPSLPPSLPPFRPRLVVTLEQREAILKQYDLPPPKQPVLVLCPGAEFGPSKQWPWQGYVGVARHFLKEGWQIWLMGSPKDTRWGKHIQMATAYRCYDFIGQTRLVEAIDLMASASLVISNDSGLMHIAASLDRPLVALFGSTDPKRTPPLGPDTEIVFVSLPCRPCFKRHCPLQHHRCMQSISVERVIEAAYRVWRK